MTIFLLCAGLLLAATVAVLVWPLVSRRRPREPSAIALNAALYAEQLEELEADRRTGAIAEADYETARTELKARLLADAAGAEARAAPDRGHGAAIALAFAVPVLAVLVYLAVGTPQAILPKPAADAAHQLTPQQVEALVERLAERLKSDPGNAEGWLLLGRSYAAFGRSKEAADAYEQAAKLRPGDAQVLADYADALGMALGRTLAGEPEKLIARALEADPRNLKALALAGTAAFDRKDYQGAAGFWQRMLPLLEAESDEARSIRANIEEARSLAGKRAAAVPAALQGEVKLAPALAGNVAPDDTVFIFARAAQGPPMPLAVLRKKARDLPLRFALDDSMSMAPEMKLSAFDKVIVAARISKSGEAAAKPGDLQGQTGPVANDAAGILLVIDSVVR